MKTSTKIATASTIVTVASILLFMKADEDRKKLIASQSTSESTKMKLNELKRKKSLLAVVMLVFGITTLVFVEKGMKK